MRPFYLVICVEYEWDGMRDDEIAVKWADALGHDRYRIAYSSFCRVS